MTPDTATPPLSRSFIHPNGTYTSPPTPASHTRASLMVVLYSPAYGSPSPSEIPHSPPPQSRSRKRTSTGAPSSSQHTASHRNRPTFAHPSLSTAPNCPFCVQPPEHVDHPAQCSTATWSSTPLPHQFVIVEPRHRRCCHSSASPCSLLW